MDRVFSPGIFPAVRPEKRAGGHFFVFENRSARGTCRMQLLPVVPLVPGNNCLKARLCIK